MWFTLVISQHYCLTSKVNTFISYAFNKWKISGLRFIDIFSKKHQILQRFTNIFLIKSHMNLFYTEARPAYLWQNQAWLKDEVIPSCQGILVIWLPRVELLLSLCPPAKSLMERAQKTRNSAAAIICQLQNDLKLEKKQNYWFWDILICQFQPWPNPIFNEKWRIQTQSKLN